MWIERAVERLMVVSEIETEVEGVENLEGWLSPSQAFVVSANERPLFKWCCIQPGPQNQSQFGVFYLK